MQWLFNPGEPQGNRTLSGFPPTPAGRIALPEFFRIDVDGPTPQFPGASGPHVLRRVWENPYRSFPPGGRDRGKNFNVFDGDQFSLTSPPLSAAIWASEWTPTDANDPPALRWWASLERLPFVVDGFTQGGAINVWFGVYDFGPVEDDLGVLGAPAPHAAYFGGEWFDPLWIDRTLTRGSERTWGNEFPLSIRIKNWWA